MRKLTIARGLAVCICGMGPSVFGIQTGEAVQRERLAKYGFVREAHDPAALGLLLGNAELGGLVDASGTALPTLWAADLWKDPHSRQGAPGPALLCDEFAAPTKPSSYRQELGLRDGVVKTRAIYENGAGYEAELFCSMAEPHLIVLRLKNLGGAVPREWRLGRPAANYTVTHPASGVILGQSSEGRYTPHAWAVRTDKPWTMDAEGREILKLAPGEEATLLFSLTTVWDGKDYAARCEAAVSPKAFNAKRLAAAHRDAWEALWRQSAVLAIPDAELEKYWYRSLFWTLSTCGSEKFLPGECQFAVVSAWGMHAFTYGAAGWAVQAYIAAGFPERARTMLNGHFKPEALQKNAAYYTRVLAGKDAAPEAWAFAHEVGPDGHRLPCDFWELQRHLDGFAATMFYRYSRYYPDAAFFREKTYPVLKGTSEFFKGLARLDEKSGEFLLPKMTSLTEDLSAIHLIDAALAAKWCLVEALRVSVLLDQDAELRASWKELADKLCIPQTQERYLEYFGDEEKRAGAGYQGIRGFVYLGYPTMELMPRLDRAKAMRTLDYTWMRNKNGEGMISFIASWFALADTQYGRGEHALDVMRHNLKCVDRWNVSFSEHPGSSYYYFTTGYTSYILVPLSMAVQSSEDRISVFPAVPAAWKDFAFYNVPAEHGLRVSGEMKDGRVVGVSYRRDGKVLLRTNRKDAVRIQRDGKAVRLIME